MRDFPNNKPDFKLVGMCVSVIKFGYQVWFLLIKRSHVILSWEGVEWSLPRGGVQILALLSIYHHNKIKKPIGWVTDK